ncbi:MAG TPA: hypothetical protein VJX67_06175, partial [Blastocatellia bacterium]|nr:hypothetical protein [Blastocatellia bacterium]
GRFIITGVYYRLVKNGTPAIRYPELQKYLAQAGKGAPDLAQAREAVLSIRRKKAMLIDSSDPDSRSAGSFFMNPIVTPEVLDQIRQRSHLRDAVRDMPVFGTDDGNWKLSAGWLIEAAGFKRGHVAGGVGLSSKHPLAIVNRGGGTAREVIQLVDQIRSHVFDAFGVLLVTEPVFVGFDESLGEKRGSVSSGLGSTMRESAELGAWFDEE